MGKNKFIKKAKESAQIQKINDQIPEDFFTQTLLESKWAYLDKPAIINKKWIWMISLVIAPILTSVLTYFRYASNKYPGYLDFLLIMVFKPVISPMLSLVKIDIEIWELFSVLKSIIGILVMALFMKLIKSNLFMQIAISISVLILITIVFSFGEIVIG